MGASRHLRFQPLFGGPKKLLTLALVCMQSCRAQRVLNRLLRAEQTHHRQMLSDRRRLDSTDGRVRDTDGWDGRGRYEGLSGLGYKEHLNVELQFKKFPDFAVPDEVEEPWNTSTHIVRQKRRDENMLWGEIMSMFTEKEHRVQRRSSISSTCAEPEELFDEEYRYEVTQEKIEKINEEIYILLENFRREEKESQDLKKALRKMYKGICREFMPRQKYMKIKDLELIHLKNYATDISQQIIAEMNQLISDNPKLYTEISTKLRNKIEWVPGSSIHKEFDRENIIVEENKNAGKWGRSDIKGAEELREALRDRNSKATRYYDEKYTIAHFVWNRLS